jgi:hypothetical protein
MLWLATTPAAPRAELLFTGRELEMSDIHLPQTTRTSE